MFSSLIVSAVIVIIFPELHSHIFRGNNAGNVGVQGNKFRGGRKWMKAVPNAHVRSEIKDLDQVRKERQKKADRLSYIKSKGNKGKKSGKTGKRGRSNSKSK